MMIIIIIIICNQNEAATLPDWLADQPASTNTIFRRALARTRRSQAIGFS